MRNDQPNETHSMAEDPDGQRMSKTSPDELPKLQIFILTLARMTEPISFTVIFPMVTFMIDEFNPSLSKDQVGYYCGFIETTFSISQFLTLILWGKLSDAIGRKPVLLIGLAGVALSTFSFGLSYSLLSMIISRAIGGALNGNAAVIKSMFGELTNSENQARVFSLLPVCFAVGSIIGPLLGGYLNRPADQFPNSWFATSIFWRNHPWLLPCLVASLAPLLAFIIAAIWLKETLPPSSKKRHSNNEREPLLQAEEQDVIHHRDNHDNLSAVPFVKPSISIFDLLKDSNLVTILSSYSILSFQTISLDAIFTLFAYTPIESGGLGFSSQDIGLALSLSQGFSILAQLILFPFAHKRLGTARLYKLCMLAYPFIFLFFPIVNYIARREKNLDGEVTDRTQVMFGVWIGIWIISISKASANMVFSCNMLLVNSAAPSRTVLSTINGMAQTCASFVRAVGPITSSGLYAVSIEKLSDYLGGHSIFLLYSIISIFGFLLSLRLEDERSSWRDS